MVIKCCCIVRPGKRTVGVIVIQKWNWMLEYFSKYFLNTCQKRCRYSLEVFCEVLLMEKIFSRTKKKKILLFLGLKRHLDIFILCLLVPCQAKKCLQICTKCRFRSSCACASYYPGLCSPFIHSVVSNDSVADSEDPDQTAGMRWLILVFAVCTCPKTCFSIMQIII